MGADGAIQGELSPEPLAVVPRARLPELPVTVGAVLRVKCRIEKSIVFTYTEKLGLCHFTQGEGENKHILIAATPPSAPVSQKQSKGSGRKSRSGSVSGEIEVTPPRRQRRMSCPDFSSDVPVRKPIGLPHAAPVCNRVAQGPDGKSIGFKLHRTVE